MGGAKPFGSKSLDVVGFCWGIHNRWVETIDLNLGSAIHSFGNVLGNLGNSVTDLVASFFVKVSNRSFHQRFVREDIQSAASFEMADCEDEVPAVVDVS